MTRYSTIKKFADVSGYSEAAIRTKLSRRKWPQDEVWIRAPDNRILIDVDGFERWAEGYQSRNGARAQYELITNRRGP